MKTFIDPAAAVLVAVSHNSRSCGHGFFTGARVSGEERIILYQPVLFGLALTSGLNASLLAFLSAKAAAGSAGYV